MEDDSSNILFEKPLVEMGVDRSLFDDLSDVITFEVDKNCKSSFAVTEKGKAFIKEAERRAKEDLPKERVRNFELTTKLIEAIKEMSDEEFEEMLKKADLEADAINKSIESGEFSKEQSDKIKNGMREEMEKYLREIAEDGKKIKED